MTDRDEEIPETQRGYDRWARVYDHDGNPLQALEEPHMRELVGDVQGRKVLDIGCGTGRHSLWMAAAGALVTGVDFSVGMMAEARRKPGADRVRFVKHDLHRRFPFESSSFDCVVSGLVLEHIKDLPAFMAEAYRVLSPGGYAVISSMHPAMMLRGTQANFTDPETGEKVRPGSFPHQISDFVMAALAVGFSLEYIGEDAPDDDFGERFPRAKKYVGWPMLVILRLVKHVNAK
ncbi:MAG: class I SAM-dependent methyltransferase [Acidobacteria bacterium]|nr:MAG: class I SAM-dependent methyltransferase [Acidobacteriota bacterium]